MIAAQSAFSDSKKHLLILDALRGIAAIMVVSMHTFEIFCGGDYHKLIINHGYLAVDFFFMLSGYVMAHAYDDRWGSLTIKDFFKRRLIRLHPLIILGMIFGAIFFYNQQSAFFPKIADTSVINLILVMLIGFTLIPIPTRMDIRGWSEMHPLNGPAWSLFFEYLANILHAFILRKLPNRYLGLLVVLAGANLYYVAITSPAGDLIGGWSLQPQHLAIGFTRLLFPYMAGMLLRRMVKIQTEKNTFFIASILLILVLASPRMGGYDNVWVNGLYEALILSIAFPIIIYLGAIGKIKHPIIEKCSIALGDISYPLYITHFPFICVYYAWVSNNKVPLELGVKVGIPLIIATIGIAYLALKLYDLPIRKWLTKRFMHQELATSKIKS